MSPHPRLALTAALATALASAPAAARDKVALLVGVNEYADVERLKPLRFAEADVTALAEILRGAGYRVTLLTGAAPAERQPTKANIEARLREVLRACRAGDTAVVALAGHGLQFDGQADAFFCPPEARPFADEAATLVSLTRVYDELVKSFAGVKVLLVDACRNDPDASRGARSGVTADLAPRPPSGVAALFSCKAGERAYEHPSLGHGVFFHHVLQGLRGGAADRQGFVTFGGLSDYVAREVSTGEQGTGKLMSGARQSPSTRADYTGVPVLLRVAPPAAVAAAPAPGPRPLPPVIAVPKAGPPPVPHVVQRPPEARPGFTNFLGMRFVRVPRGTIYLGGGGGKLGPVPFTLADDLYCGVHEVTQGEWAAVMGNNFSRFRDAPDADRCPVEDVSFDDVTAFLARLNAGERARRGGRAYRLPTEYEWEYVCRGGPASPAESAHHFYCGEPSNALSGRDANFNAAFPVGGAARLAELYPDRTRRVGSYRPNKLGVYDMHGNVGEWTISPFQKGGTDLVIRGGSWFDAGTVCAAAARLGFPASLSNGFIGFRLIAVPAE